MCAKRNEPKTENPNYCQSQTEAPFFSTAPRQYELVIMYMDLYGVYHAYWCAGYLKGGKQVTHRRDETAFINQSDKDFCFKNERGVGRGCQKWEELGLLLERIGCVPKLRGVAMLLKKSRGIGEG